MIASRLGLVAVCCACAALRCSYEYHCIEIQPDYSGTVQLPAPYAYYGTRKDGPGSFGGDWTLPDSPDPICAVSEGKDESWTLVAWIFPPDGIGCPPSVARCAPNPQDPQGATDFIFKKSGTTVVQVTISDFSP